MLFNFEAFLTSGALFSLGNGEALLGYGALEWEAKRKETALYFPDFFLREKKPWLCPEKTELIKIETLLEALRTEGELPTLTFEEGDFSLYQKHFFDLKEKIARQEMQKGVLYSFERGHLSLTSSHLAKLLENILSYATKNHLWVYGFWDGNQGVLGATPEVLFDLNDPLQLKTMACAGSSLKLDGNQKLKEEHQWVVDGLKEALEPLGRVVIGEKKQVAFGRLYHFVTPIEVNLGAQVSFEECVQALHPTAALGAFPLKRALPWLSLLNEELPRGHFGAPVGCVYKNRDFCLVAIRNIQWDGASIFMGAGGGVVQDSHLEAEWKELKWKWQSIKTSLFG